MTTIALFAIVIIGFLFVIAFEVMFSDDDFNH